MFLSYCLYVNWLSAHDSVGRDDRRQTRILQRMVRVVSRPCGKANNIEGCQGMLAHLSSRLHFVLDCGGIWIIFHWWVLSVVTRSKPIDLIPVGNGIPNVFAYASPVIFLHSIMKLMWNIMILLGCVA